MKDSALSLLPAPALPTAQDALSKLPEARGANTLDAVAPKRFDHALSLAKDEAPEPRRSAPPAQEHAKTPEPGRKPPARARGDHAKPAAQEDAGERGGSPRPRAKQEVPEADAAQAVPVVSPGQAFNQLAGGDAQESARAVTPGSLADLLQRLAQLLSGLQGAATPEEQLAALQDIAAQLQAAVPQDGQDALKALSSGVADAANAAPESLPAALDKLELLVRQLGGFGAVLQATEKHSGASLSLLAPQAAQKQLEGRQESQRGAGASQAEQQALAAQEAEHAADAQAAAPDAKPALAAALLSQDSGQDSQDSSRQDARQAGVQDIGAAQAAGTGLRSGESGFARVLTQLQQASAASAADQLVAHVKSAVKNGDSRIQIQLNPVELGKLEINMAVSKEGKTSLHITADNPRTLELLRSDARVLETMLTDIGLKADAGSLSFNLRGEQQQGGHGRDSQGEGYRGKTVEAVEEALAQAAAETYTIEAAEGLDIRI